MPNLSKMAIFFEMTDLYNSTESGQSVHDILDVILRDPKRFGDASITKAAEYCVTTPASMTRMIQKLGYRNYSEFKYELRNFIAFNENSNPFLTLSPIPGASNTEQYLNNLESIIRYFRDPEVQEQIDRLVDRLMEASVVYLLYSGGFRKLLHTLQDQLLLSGKRTVYVSNPHTLLSSGEPIEEGALFFVVLESSNDLLENMVPFLSRLEAAKATATIIGSLPRANCSSAVSMLNYPYDISSSAFFYSNIYINMTALKYRDRARESRGQV